MSEKSSTSKRTERKRLLRVVQAVLWVAICFVGAQVLVAVVMALLGEGLRSLASEDTLALLLRLMMLVVMVAALLGMPRLWGEEIPRRQLGLARPLKWSDIGWAIVGVIAAYIASMLLAVVAQWLLVWIDMAEPQNLGLSALTPGVEMTMAFMVLVVVGPIVEEVVFRGYLYGRLQALHVRFWARTLLVSGLFAVAHWQWNVALDVFALSVIMCLLREKTGSLWPSIVMHMIKNGVAFYFVFVNPLMVGIM